MRFSFKISFTFKESNTLENSKLFESGVQTKVDFVEKSVPLSTNIAYNETSRLKTSLPIEKFDLWTRKAIQGTSRDSQDVTEINYSQFRNKLVEKKDHNSTFQKRDNIIVSGNKYLINK